MFERLFNYSQLKKGKKQSKEPAFSSIYPSLQITDRCNKQCKGCLHSANSTSYEMSGSQFEKYLEDLRRLSENTILKYQFVTGGEPTTWRAGEMDIVNALESLFDLRLAETLFMPTNGKNFEDLNYTRDFFKRLSSQVNCRIIMGISISECQENLDETGYIALDNLLSISSEPWAKVTPNILVTLGADDDTDLRLKKIYPGVFQRIMPFAPFGDGADMEERAPSLSLYGNDKKSLGSYLPYFREEAARKLKISESDFNGFPNSALIDMISLYNHCGEMPFVNERWHYCLLFKDEPRFDLCDVGSMRSGTIPDFLEEREILQCIRAEGILSGVDEHRDELSSEARDKLDYLYSPEVKIAMAYRGCMVCKKMYDYGIIKELVDGNSSSKR